MSDVRRLVRLARDGVPASTAELVNYVPNPSFESGTSPWATTGSNIAAGATLAQSALVTAQSGGFSGRIVTDTVTSLEGVTVNLGVLAAGTYNASLYIRGAVGGEAVQVLAGVTSGPTQIFASTVTTSWQRVSGTFIADGVTACQLMTRRSGTSALTWYIDAAQVTSGASLLPYFDGDTPGYGWYGTYQASTSGSLQSVVRNLENGSTFQSIRDSWKVNTAPRKTNWSRASRRYGGARAASEIHDENGSVEWQILVNGATADAALQNVEALLGDVESSQLDLYLEWKPEGATNTEYFEIRGPCEWSTDYKWAQFSGARSLIVSVRVPVAPLVLYPSYVTAIASTTLPSTVQLAAAVTGDAPALMDITLTHGTGVGAAPIWAKIGWARRPGSPLASSSVPFGFIEAESGTLTTWASTANAAYRGGNGAEVTTSGAGTASAVFAVDPSTLVADDFTPGEVDVEVWASVRIANGVISPKLTVSLEPFAGTPFGNPVYDPIYGSSGKLITKPSSGTTKRYVRLGVVSMPVDAITPLKHNLRVAASWAVGSTGVFGLDYIDLNLARQRALSVTGKANDASYPKFIASTAATSKRIRGADLSGAVASGTGNFGRDSGLGGQLIEVAPGNVDLSLKLSSLVPDDPTSDTTDEQLQHAVTGTVRVTPRGYIARGA